MPVQTMPMSHLRFACGMRISSISDAIHRRFVRMPKRIGTIGIVYEGVHS